MKVRVRMSRRNKQILYAWLEGLVSAFWDGVAGASVLDGVLRGTGVQFVDGWAELQAAIGAGVMLGFVSMRRKLQQSPLPKFEFEEAEEPPKE